MAGQEVLIGIDAGTSVIKAVAFDLAGRQLACGAVPNEYRRTGPGAVTQSLAKTWENCVTALRRLGEQVPDLAARTLGVAVTGQGDGIWLVGAQNRPMGDAWLWLDARAAPAVQTLEQSPLARARFEATGTGLNTCQQGSQMAYIDRFFPELLEGAETAFHCKDWLYLNLTGVRASDPSEMCFTFGNFRTRRYDDQVIAALGLSHRRYLLPDVVDGTQITHSLTVQAAVQTGLRAGTPISLGYVDMVMTALGTGVYAENELGVACSTIGSTGVHLRAKRAEDVVLNAQRTGYVIALPVPGIVTQVQTNMAATLNFDWILSLAADLLRDFGQDVTPSQVLARMEGWLAQAQAGQILYHPYISEAGERGPFVDALARASFTGLSAIHRFPDLVRAVAEGLALAMRDCYQVMGDMPHELRLTGGAARSQILRGILAAAINAPVRICAREETGAAGAAMMAAVALGVYETMDACVRTWVHPLLADGESPDPALVALYRDLYPAFRKVREELPPVWTMLADHV